MNPPLSSLIEPKASRDSILDNLEHSRRKVDFSEASGVLRKCSCRCVWCPTCHKKYFMPKEAVKMALFDWQRTRHLCLTMPRTVFDSPSAAYLHVTEKKMLAALIKGLRKGVRFKRGNRWFWKYEPVKIAKWYWALEWHKDGFPHWHLLIEVADEGQAGMIGGDRIRHYWESGWIKETYFRSESHFASLVGYYGKHGYFEKAKAHQGILPEAIKNDLKGRRIERTGGGMGRPSRANGSEGHKPGEARKCNEDVEKKRYVDYTVTLGNCGLYSQVSMKMNDVEVTVITDIPYSTIKEKIGGEYVAGEGIMATIGESDVEWILDRAVKVSYFSVADHEAYERWSRKLRINIEREMIRGCYDLNRNRLSSEVNLS